MSNPRSASNAWANIKKKIMAKGGVTNGGASPIKKGTNGSEAGGAEGEGGETPTKPKATPKKRAAPKAKVDGESPTKKAKGNKGKAADVDREDSPVKAEPEDGETFT